MKNGYLQQKDIHGDRFWLIVYNFADFLKPFLEEKGTQIPRRAKRIGAQMLTEALRKHQAFQDVSGMLTRALVMKYVEDALLIAQMQRCFPEGLRVK